MTLSLKTAKRVLLAAGYDASEISELVRGIKADAWDKGFVEGDVLGIGRDPSGLDNPYRTAPPSIELHIPGSPTPSGITDITVALVNLIEAIGGEVAIVGIKMRCDLCGRQSRLLDTANLDAEVASLEIDGWVREPSKHRDICPTCTTEGAAK